MNNLLQNLKNLSPGRMASILAIVIFLVSFFVYIAMQIGSTEYAVLYTDLELEDAKQIVTRLETDNVKYKLTRNGTEILVPRDVVNRARIETSELAITSKGANVGYEIFDNSDALGSTNFVQNINLVRALEGELARTIRSVDNIKSARVHLVLPKREMFAREEQAPSASVVIKANGRLSTKNIQSIQKLVAAAVPKLEVKNVAIVDNAGNLLTNNYEDEQTLVNTNNEILRQDQERKVAASVQNLLEKAIGVGKVRAQVNIEMDFDQVVTNEEIYDPDSQVVRSQASITEEGTARDGERSVSVAQNIPNGDSAVNNGQFSQNSRTEETINYEISKVVTNKIRNNGIIKRLSVAVMVDGIYDKDAEGNPVYRNRTQEEMEQLASLVKSTVGYDADRGDQIEVENLRFVSTESELDAEEYTSFLGFSKEDLMRMLEGLGVAVVAILVILLVIRPLINNAFDAGAAPDNKLIGDNTEDENLLISNFLNEDDSGIEELISLNKIDGRIKVSTLNRLNELIAQNPDSAVNVIRNWLYQNEN